MNDFTKEELGIIKMFILHIIEEYPAFHADLETTALLAIIKDMTVKWPRLFVSNKDLHND